MAFAHFLIKGRLSYLFSYLASYPICGYMQVIKSYYPERHPNAAAWREIYLLPASHCSNPHELDDVRLSANSLLALTTESGRTTAVFNEP
jgi:hypothetical protein